MRKLYLILTSLVLAAAPPLAFADPWNASGTPHQGSVHHHPSPNVDPRKWNTVLDGLEAFYQVLEAVNANLAHEHRRTRIEIRQIRAELSRLREIAYGGAQVERHWSINLYSGDDGYRVRVAGHLVQERKTIFHSPASPDRINPYHMVLRKAVEAFRASDTTKQRAFDEILRKLESGKPVKIVVECLNQGGPSSVRFEILNRQDVVLAKKNYAGSNAPGKSCEHEYELLHYREQPVLRKTKQVP